MPTTGYVAEQGAPAQPMSMGRDLEGLAAGAAPLLAALLIGWHTLRAYNVRARVLEKARE